MIAFRRYGVRSSRYSLGSGTPFLPRLPDGLGILPTTSKTSTELWKLAEILDKVVTNDFVQRDYDTTARPKQDVT